MNAPFTQFEKIFFSVSIGILVGVGGWQLKKVQDIDARLIRVEQKLDDHISGTAHVSKISSAGKPETASVTRESTP